jgi:hypothetical protein
MTVNFITLPLCRPIITWAVEVLKTGSLKNKIFKKQGKNSVDNLTPKLFRIKTLLRGYAPALRTKPTYP